ncbi:MAG: hypothetical protein LH467_15245, partial [Gemmatimonadaceae bacterium]|nr:hypothetical protein [Gemmatimonadaceae bacterium]
RSSGACGVVARLRDRSSGGGSLLSDGSAMAFDSLCTPSPGWIILRRFTIAEVDEMDRYPQTGVTLRTTSQSLIAGALLSAAAILLASSSSLQAEGLRCTLVPGKTLAVVRVEQDTTLPVAASGIAPMSSSGIRSGVGDSMLATPTTPMPAARVRLLRLDSASRAILAGWGITDSQPFAFIRAAPYRADCRTVRWTDSIPFVEPGEVGYIRGNIAPREQWIGGVPVLIIPEAWRYPYPRRRGLAFRAAPDAVLASADAMFELEAALNMDRPIDAETGSSTDSVKRTRALSWARANPAASELEPVRTLVRQAVLNPDWEVASRFPSRLRGSYRVSVDVNGERNTWFFRTHDRPGYSWRRPDVAHTTADLLTSPNVAGYSLVGYASASPDSIPTSPSKELLRSMVWLGTTDRPTMPGNDARRVLPGMLEFTLLAAPESLWDVLEAFVPRPSALDSAMMARLQRPIVRSQRQPRLPLTLRLDGRGGVRADTTLTIAGRSMRIVLERLDTLSVKRPF